MKRSAPRSTPLWEAIYESTRPAGDTVRAEEPFDGLEGSEVEAENLREVDEIDVSNIPCRRFFAAAHSLQVIATIQEEGIAVAELVGMLDISEQAGDSADPILSLERKHDEETIVFLCEDRDIRDSRQKIHDRLQLLPTDATKRMQHLKTSASAI
jgi:hypothetical protein